MKRILLIISILVIFAIASISGLAQTRPAAKPSRIAPQTVPGPTANVPNTRIAIIDTSVFEEEKAGITRYTNAVKAVENEFREITTANNTLDNRIKALKDEITRLSRSTTVDPRSIADKLDQLQTLERQLKHKILEAHEAFEKRFEEALRPVSTDIGKAMDQYATQNGLTMILDISKLQEAVLTMNPAVDITRAFIAEYNSKNP